MLKIVRTYKDDQGRTFQREELIRQNELLIQSYVRIRQTKSDKFMFD